MLTDTHCHLDLAAFDADRAAVIERAIQAGIARILIPGLDIESSSRVVQMALAHSILFAAVGLHPTESHKYDDGTLEQLRRIAREPRVVAIGEIGLDYYWVKAEHERARQREALQEQLRLASDLHLPAVIHCRNEADAEDGSCSEDLLSLLSEWVHAAGPRSAVSQLPGVLHSFSGSLQSARRAMELGFYIGVTGPVTFKNSASRRELIRQLPLERLLIETDAPYLSPHPHRGQRNEPAYVAHIADKIADIQSRTPQEVAAVTGDNAARLFSWGETA